MSDWSLIYRTNENGDVVSGSLSGLREAVLDAADVKVLYQTQGGTWWSRYCPSVTVGGSGPSTVVSAVFMHAADTVSAAGGLAFADPFAIEYHLFNSTGIRAMVKVGANGEVVDIDRDTLAMRWYVRDRQWSPRDLIAEVVAEQLEATRR
jgi:hypothetical protein